MMFRRRKEKRCNNILQDIMTTEEIFTVYYDRVRSSLMQNDGNIMQVYQEISFAISKDYGEGNKDICDRISVALVTIMRSSVNSYSELEFRYHG